MNHTKNKGATLWTALKVLLDGKSPAIGRYRGWKSFIFNTWIVAPVAITLVMGKQIEIISGAVPPASPVIGEEGKFVELSRDRAHWIAFSTRSGHVYNIERGTFLAGALHLPFESPPPTVYAEGFLREGGAGNFWPLLVRTLDGRVLISAEQSLALLHKTRRQNVEMIFIDLGVWVIMGIFSLKILKKIKARLSEEF